LRRRVLRCSLLLLATIWTIASLRSAYAFSVSPARVEISLSAGGNYEGSFTVTNTEEEPILLGVTLEDRSVGTSEPGRGRAALEWLEISPKALEMLPGETETVKYVINVPEASQGECLARISFTKTPAPGNAMIGVQSVMSFSIYVIIEGTESIMGDISRLYIFNTDPLELRVTMKNTGNIHIRPKGKVVLVKEDWFWKRAEEELVLPLNKYEFPIYPFSERTLKIKSKEKLLPGKYKAIMNMEFGPMVIQKEFSFTVHGDGKASEAKPR